MERKHITAGGVPMQWEQAGEGIPLILVHGIPTSPRLWRHVVPGIRGARCMAWEMVGYGGSIEQGRDRDISIAKQAEYLLAWMDELGIEQAVLAGHDLGGGVVQVLAAHHPQRVAGMFLTNAIGYDSWPIPSVKAMRAMAPLVERTPVGLFERIFGSFIRQGHDDSERATESIQEHWPFYVRRDPAAAFGRQIRSLDVRDTLAVADRLRTLDLPARVVWGAADRFQKLHYGQRFSRDLKAPLRTIEGGKHFTPEDHPDVVAEELNQLVTAAKQRLESTGAGLAQGAPAPGE